MISTTFCRKVGQSCWGPAEQCLGCTLTTPEVSGKHEMLPKTKDQRRFNEYATCGTRLLLQHRRKRNKKYKLLQSYLPLLGWGFLSLLAIVLAFREHRFSGARHTLREAHKDMQSLQNQQVQMQVMFCINAESFTNPRSYA